MATYNDLTPAEQALVTAFMSSFRQGVGQIAQALNRLETMRRVWEAAVVNPITSLDPGEHIPDSMPGQGAAALMREDVLQIMGAIDLVLSTHNGIESRARYIAVAGLPATMA